MSEYQNRLDALYQLEFFGMKLGLENIRALLDSLGHPEHQFNSIHIAGTNGKGSVSAMLAAVHQSAGKRTGLYTSPHLIDFRERIRINGRVISEEEVARFLEQIWPNVEQLKATFFEVTTAMAFDHFARHAVDIAIIETGLGGRLDATNVLEHPLATVVTSIGHDHHAQLGPTLEDIAREKAGIFKSGVPAIVNCPNELRPVFEERAKEVNAKITWVHDEHNDANTNWNIPFAGTHQIENLNTVLATLAAPPYRFPDELIRQGISETINLTGLHGRMEEIVWPEIKELGNRFFIDVGHNPEALQAVKAFFDDMDVRPIVIFGIMKDKDVDQVLQIVKSFASEFVAVAADTPRAMESNELMLRAQALGLSAIDGGSVIHGVHVATDNSEGKTFLLGGSHYVVGEFLRELSMGNHRFAF